MDQLITSVGQLILSWGAPGVFILYLLREQERFKADVVYWRDKATASFEARITESREGIKAISSVENSINTLAAVLKDRKPDA